MDVNSNQYNQNFGRLINVSDCGQPNIFGIPAKISLPADPESWIAFAGLLKPSGYYFTHYKGFLCKQSEMDSLTV